VLQVCLPSSDPYPNRPLRSRHQGRQEDLFGRIGELPNKNNGSLRFDKIFDPAGSLIPPNCEKTFAILASWCLCGEIIRPNKILCRQNVNVNVNVNVKQFTPAVLCDTLKTG
jgi:hypothetical protein